MLYSLIGDLTGSHTLFKMGITSTNFFFIAQFLGLELMRKTWQQFFTPEARKMLSQNIRLALEEDGPELTSRGIFSPDTLLKGILRSKEKTFVCGLPLIGIVLKNVCDCFSWRPFVREGEKVDPYTQIAEIIAPAEALLKAERVILNYITHLSGVANLVSAYVQQLSGTGVKLLDTRKTIPGLRWPEKYAVMIGGGTNHRMNLSEMLMLKDNHIDAAGSIKDAIHKLRQFHNPCPPIEVECRTIEDVREALEANADRIMLDNMQGELLINALNIIPASVEAEISGGVTLENIRSLAICAERHPDFISVGRLTHSAPAADFSMMIAKVE